MNDEQKSKTDLINELRILRQQLSQLEQNNVSREDRIKLSIINNAPFSAWACNRNFEIVFWSGGTAKVYGYSGQEAIGKNYLRLFVSDEERERSASDTLDVIDKNIELRNFLAYDQLSDGSKRALLTNCFRIWDDGENDYLQAEVALEVPELTQSIEQHRSLRELGIKRTAEYERILLLERLGNITTLISSSILGNEGLRQVFLGINEIVNAVLGKEIVSEIFLKSAKNIWEPEAFVDDTELFVSIKTAILKYSDNYRRVLFVDNENDIPNDLPELLEWREKYNNLSIAILPLISNEKMVGVWLIAIQKPYLFEESVRESLRLIANQVSFSVSIAQLVQSLKDLNSKIAEKQDLITRSIIAVDFVHRMNNLAGPIQGWTGLITETLDLTNERDQKIKGYLEEINLEVKELLKASNRLEETPRPRGIDVNFMINAMLRNVKIQFLDVQVDADLRSDVHLVNAIYSQLSDAIWNMISNALDAMPMGGTLSIETKNIELNDKKWVTIKVSDTGIGISEENRNNIFELNYTTKENGRGYGLWRTRHILEDLGGQILLNESEPMKGTTFTVILPANG